MKIHIDDNKTLEQIRNEFHKGLPHLKIEFFAKPHGSSEGSAKTDLLEKTKTVGEVRRKHNEGDIVFDLHTTVAELEKEFQDKYGISAQVFRKSGDKWLETSKTDEWTLEKQNETAKEADTKFNINLRNFARND